MRYLLVIAAIFASATADFVSYEGCKVYQLHPTNQKQQDVIASFISNEYFDFWTNPIPKMLGLPATVMVYPEAQNEFVLTLDEAKIPYNVLIENVESATQTERAHQAAALKLGTGRISFTEYHPIADINEYLVQIAEDYPDIAQMEVAHATIEGRPIRMLKIGTGGSDRPVILIEAGIHAREWIAPAFALYLIRELVENESNRYLIENVDWYIIPVLNPDGYEYTHTTQRLWRKTRLPNWDSDCIGADANRNFAYQWMTVGASDNPCSETFAGYRSFNQYESMALRNVVEYYQMYRNQVKLYLSLHSYGQYILYPWGFTTELPDDADELHELSTQVGNAISAVSGTRYTIGSTANVLYYASGVSPDWVRGVAGVNHSYTIELPGGGSYGFDLPASRILDVCEETFEGIKVYHNYVEENLIK